MSFLNKLGIAIGATPRESAPAVRHDSSNHRPANGHGNSAVGSRLPAAGQETSRISNGLKEFLWNLDGLGHGTLLDLGPAWQTTLSFFIERGFRVTSDDILRSWSEFQKQQNEQPATTVEEFAERTPEAMAKRFLKECVDYPAASFDALLLWDVLDYLEPTLGKLLVAHLTEKLRSGGVVFAMFHSKKPEGFQRYRVLDTATLQVLSAQSICPAQKVYQNREIQELFSRYRTTKSFVSRDQLRETLFLK